MGNEEAVFFELNNWMPGEDYPNAEPFLSWMGNDRSLRFLDDGWLKRNRLRVCASIVDMSVNFCITAEKGWVRKNCPSLLTEFREFLRIPEEDGFVEGRFGDKFPEYDGRTFGLEWIEEDASE